MTKYQMISALAEYTARNVVQSEENWKHYLTTAARLYKYPFNEQDVNIRPKTGYYSLCFSGNVE